MSKALKVIGTIAGAVALVAGTIATAGIGTAAFAATMGTIATASGLAAGFATIGAQALYKPPPARGSVTNVLIAVDPPSPYVMGEGYFAGVLRHDVGYGATLKKVPNPYRLMVAVYSHGGPVQSISPRVELDPVGSYYNGFLYTDTQLGACPETSALGLQFAGAPGWGAASKLSGQAAIAWNLKFDKDGKRFASGVPRFGAYGQWVKAYDPRKDSTFPGGAGAHRLGVESTYEWTQNPALHAGTYAYGRYQNGKRVMGIGMPASGIDWVGLAGWANVCDANGWTIFGPVYEPGNRWENLQEIAAAGGGRAVFAGGLISWRYSAPMVALDTITDADIADDSYSVTAMASWRDRLNTIVPKYISPDHDWQLIADADPVTIAEYVTEDGEVKQVEWPFNLVKNGDQAAQLAAYKMLDSRELQPIVLPCLPRLRRYRPGECLHIDLPELGLDTDAVILSRSFDPARMTVTLTLIGETPGKHDFALGRTATPPPTPALKQTAEERDNLRWAVQLDQGARTAEYDAGAIYSEGMTVRLPDGSTWEYIGAAPGSGNAPPTWPETSNAYWTNLTPPTAAPTDRSPAPPLELNEGTLWIAPDGHPYRFGRRPWVGADGEAWIGGDGEAWLGSGYSDVQDQLGVEAMAAAEAVTAQVARIASDGWLTAGEKSGLVLSHKAMIENHVALDAKAAALGVAASERTNATNAVNALNAYLTGLSPAWNDTTQDTEAAAATITALWGDAAQKVALLQAAVQGLPGPPGAPGADGVDGIDGTDGKLVEFVWKRAASAPVAPTGGGIPAGWSDDPPAGSDPLWMSKAKQELDGSLVAGESWSTPVRHDGPAALDLAAAPASVVIPANFIGAVNSGALPVTVQMTARLGESDATGSVSWPAASVTNCQVTNLGGGAYRIDDITADTAYFDVEITHGGQTTARRVTLAKARAGADAQRAQTSSFGTPGASWAAASGSLIALNVFPSTTITLSMSASYDAATAGSCRVLARLMYRNVTDGGSWTQAGSDITGSYANNTGGTEPELTPGSAGGGANVSAPSSAKSYEFRLDWVKDGFATIDMASSTFQVSIS